MRNKIALIFLILNFSANHAIYNGLKASPHQFPYIVLLNSPMFYCAGALISDKHVICAAHCLMSVKPGGSIKVSLGVHEYYGNSVSDGVLVTSKKFWIHEKFSMPSAVYDIGLIELEKPIVWSNLTQFIGIDKKINADLNANDSEVVLAGWGHFSPGRISMQLRYTTMKLISFKECQKYKSNYIELLTKDHICAKKITNMPCDGDSGTPLVSKKTGKIVGILSYVKDAENGIDIGYNDCKSSIPAVATRISSYVEWIAEKSGLKF